MWMTNEDFAKRFRLAVEHAGVEDTQAALGKLLGVSGVTVWSYRNGSKLPRMKKAAEIAKALGVNVNWLMTGQGDMVDHSSASEAESELLRIFREANDKQKQYLVDTFRLVEKQDKDEQS